MHTVVTHLTHDATHVQQRSMQQQSCTLLHQDQPQAEGGVRVRTFSRSASAALSAFSLRASSPLSRAAMRSSRSVSGPTKKVGQSVLN